MELKACCVLQKVIIQQRKKEALKLYDQKTAETMLRAHDAQVISSSDAGHTFSLNPSSHPGAAQAGGMSNISENSDEMLSTMDWASKLDRQSGKRPARAKAVSLAETFYRFLKLFQLPS